MAVWGTATQAAPDASSAREAIRSAAQVLARDAALSAFQGALPTAGLLVFVPGLLAVGGALLGCPGTEVAPAAGWLLACAALALAGPRWAARTVSVWRPAAVSSGLAVCLTALPALPGSACASSAVISIAAMGIALGAATLLAVAPWATVLWVTAPLALGLLAVRETGSLVWAGLGACMAALAAGLCVWHYRHWHRTMRAQIDHEALAREYEHQRDEAWRSDNDKSRFLANASHDLRQPVHALGLFAATLQRRLVNSPDEPLARNLLRAVDGLERSFNVILDISKLDAGALVPRMETFPLRDMFRRLHMQYAGQAEFAGLNLRFAPGGKSVTSDPQLLERIVGNLIQNAIKYTAQGGVIVAARSTRRCINVEVWDTGQGILPAELPRIFEEFYQVGRGERDRSHGLGMGLAIVKRLAAVLGHRLEVTSTVGHGTCFRIGVPLGGLPGIQEDMAPADTQPMALLEPQMVLVIDDEEPIREGLRLLLEEWGYNAMTATDGPQAEQVATALEGRIDLILSDLHLGGGMDGVEAIANVRRLCGRDVPAVLITGDTAHEHIGHVAEGDCALLFKPVQPRRLYEVIRAALR